MFHPRNPIYRNPTGAVQAHTNIHFKLLVPRGIPMTVGTPYGWGRIYKTGKNTACFGVE